MGEPLEYRGRGIEKMLGALLVLGGVFVPLGSIGMVIAAFSAGGDSLLAGLWYVPAYVVLIYLVGVAVYRSQRYRFSRTSWRGIRGGMINGGWSYGCLHLKMTLLQVVTLGFAIPYAAVRLWNARMNDAVFGSLPVSSRAQWQPLLRRFMTAWIAALAIYAGIVVMVFRAIPDVVALLSTGPARLHALTVGGGVLIGFLMLGLLLLGYHAAMLRELVGNTRVGTMALAIDVTPTGLLRFYLGNIGLVVCTFGLGIVMMPYRVFGFYALRVSTVGSFDADAVLQTGLVGPIRGNGLAEAFDMTAF